MSMKNSNVAYAFACGDEEAEGSNMFIRGDTIYSYGHHFPMAKRIGPNEYLFNSDSYSISTGKQQGYVRQALKGATVWDCPDCDINKLSDELKYEADKAYIKLRKARSCFLDYINQLERIRAQWESSKKRFKLGDRALTMKLKFEKIDWLSALIVQHSLMGRC